MKFLLLWGYSQSQFAVPGSQLNMAVIVFFWLEVSQKARGAPAKASVISEMLGNWNGTFLGRKVFIAVSFFFFFRLFSGLKRGLSRSQHYTLVSTMLFYSWQQDTSLTPLLSFAKWVSRRRIGYPVLPLIDMISHIYQGHRFGYFTEEKFVKTSIYVWKSAG